MDKNNTEPIAQVDNIDCNEQIEQEQYPMCQTESNPSAEQYLETTDTQVTTATQEQDVLLKQCNGCKVYNAKPYLMCERKWIFYILTVVAGFFGAYTYVVKGQVFCNAQTGNLLMLGLALGQMQWSKAVYYLIPLASYILGSFISEIVPNSIKRKMHIRWDTLFVLIEILGVVGISFIPATAPVQISQVAITFLMSMQYNTFRQAEGTPLTTTFATNNVRQLAVNLARLVTHRKTEGKVSGKKVLDYFLILLSFVIGVVVGTILCKLWADRAIIGALLPLCVVFIALLVADLTVEKKLMCKKPSGH